MKKIKIGGHKVKIKVYDHFDSCTNNVGTCEFIGNCIKTAKSYDGEKFHKETYNEILLHEVMHFIDYVYCGNVLDEKVIESLGKYLLYIFTKNDLFYFPEEVDILGFEYWVRYNYEFKGDTDDILIDSDTITQTIYMSNNDKMCDSYVTIGLIVGVLTVLNFEFIKNDVLKSKIHTLAQGIFQVITDNKEFRDRFKWGE